MTASGGAGGPWWSQYYREDYLASVRGILTPERTRREVAFISEAASLRVGDRVADVGCGEGRHALELGCRGCSVTAVDQNPEFLARGAAAARREGLAVRFVEADMRLAQPGPFDLVLWLFTSFGFFPDAENLDMLRAWRKELAAHGQVVIDVWNRERILRDFAPVAERRVGQHATLREERAWDAASGRLEVRYTFAPQEGEPRRYRASFRLYGAEELAALLDGVDLAVRGVYGGLDGSAWSRSAPRLVVFAQG